jgi:hypothetical protein
MLSSYPGVGPLLPQSSKPPQKNKQGDRDQLIETIIRILTCMIMLVQLIREVKEVIGFFL